jgi:nucleoside-diphosphate-sugar epimerase
VRALVTGGSGFFGRLLVPALVQRGHECVIVDLQEGTAANAKVEFIRADVAAPGVLEASLRRGRPDVVFHLASQIDFAVSSQRSLYENNVATTRAVADFARTHRVPTVIFTSSNSVYTGYRERRPVLEADPPATVDEYGRSKVESERLLAACSSDFNAISIRCPNIMDAGRLGLLSILFDFIREGRKVWVLGDGSIRHQCIYAVDLIEASIKAVSLGRSDVFNIGSNNVPTIRQMYQHVIDRARTGARVASLPASFALPAMKLAHRLGLSPLGQYQFRMLTQDFVFDTTKIKAALGWSPTLDNGQMLYKAYEYYVRHRQEILRSSDLSGNRQAVKKMGILRLLKLIS